MTVRRSPAPAPAAVLLLLAGLLVAGLLAGCGDDDDPAMTSAASGATSSGAAGTYEIALPDGWTKADDETTGEIDQAADPAIDDIVGEGAGAQIDTTDIYFRDGEGRFRTNVNVIAEPLPDSISFDQAVDDGAQLIEERLPEGELQSGPDPTTLAGDDAFAVDYSASQGGIDLQFAAIQALHDGTIYSVTLTSDAETFEEAQAEFDEIIDSWVWSQ